ncbi:MAG: phosphoesterase [Haliscomenobacter sp.]|nr:phosphoesterase [Haliscomenobacter sp.]
MEKPLLLPGSVRVLDDQSPIIMPYNRLVASAGTVVEFGNPRLENHALDVAPLPDSRYLAIEDRYGVAILDRMSNAIVSRWTFGAYPRFRTLMSTFSGLKAFLFESQTYLVWGASQRETGSSGIMVARWASDSLGLAEFIAIPAAAPAPISLPNEVEVAFEDGECHLYIALNGNNQLLKMRFRDRKTLWTAPTGVAPFGVKLAQGKAYVSNWGGPLPADPALETAGAPWGAAYIDPRTGATSHGSVSVIGLQEGHVLKEIPVGLHPNAMALSPEAQFLYVANGNSDEVTVIDTRTDQAVRTIPVGLFNTTTALIGSSPNGLALDKTGATLYVSNGLDNAVAVVQLGETPAMKGFIPTEAYPSGLLCLDNTLYVANLEATGARVRNQTQDLQQRFPKLEPDEPFEGAFNAHEQLASISVIKVPGPGKLRRYTRKVNQLNLTFRELWSRQAPRPEVAPRPVPERIGEPSLFKHVVYIIKENRTYDQVYGDLPQGRGKPELCVFGDSVTPNQHKLALEYSLLDNYYASGKSSAEGHQWTDAGIVSDYIEKSVRGWFRSYPHRQYDAMVYTKNGFIWNHALDYGKSVRIYGEACFLEFDESLTWTDIYRKYRNKEPFEFRNTSTISRVRPLLAQSFPGYDNAKINDQMRADAFIEELHAYEQMPGDSFPNLIIIALPNDHTAGMAPGYPTPRAQVADNDLALGKMIEALTKSRFWDSTVVFVTEDDSQNGWDHVSAYRTGALVISPYSRLGKTVSVNYNQISMLRTMEQILGLPPMHAIDATAEPMFACFSDVKQSVPYFSIPNRIPLDEMNAKLSALSGKALYYAQQSQEVMVEEGIDNGKDDLMNRILWFATKGDKPYPGRR